MDDSNFLNNVYGYRAIKKELKLIKDWYLDKSIDRTRLPKGILFYGSSGVGKTLLMKEYANEFNYKIFVLKGDDENVLNEVFETYAQAKKEHNSIVIIDELDSLLNNDYKLARVLQCILDGFYKNYNILTLATANSISDIPDPLLRQGRFDRIIHLSTLDEKDAKELIIGFLNELNVTLNEDEIIELVESLKYKSPVTIKSAIYDAFNRYKEKLSPVNIIKSLDLIDYGNIRKDDDLNVTPYNSIHEAGHALYTFKYSKHSKFMRVIYNNYGGATITIPTVRYESKDSRLEKIRCGLSGIIAEELIYKNHEIGCASDLDKVFDLAFRLMNRSCIKGVKNYSPYENYFETNEVSEFHRYYHEKKAYNLIKKEYKRTYRLLKKDKDLLIKISEYILKNHSLDRATLIDINNRYDKINVRKLGHGNYNDSK